MCTLISECSKFHHIAIEAWDKGEIARFGSNLLDDLETFFTRPSKIDYFYQAAFCLAKGHDAFSFSL